MKIFSLFSQYSNKEQKEKIIYALNLSFRGVSVKL